jgi:branched-chain amino acid transport system substrate-binding protein
VRNRTVAFVTIAFLATAAAAVEFVHPRIYLLESTAPATIDIGGDMSNDPFFDSAVRDGAALAVAQARTVRGYPLRFVPYDDSVQEAYSADRGAENMQQMVDDPRMLGMVGPLRGPVVKAAMPIANRAMLAMVSPTVSEPCLTRPLNRCSLFSSFLPDLAATLRPTGKNNYFHLAATDQLHGPAMAQFAYVNLGLSRIAVADPAPYVSYASDAFVAAFTKLGGEVVARQAFDVNAGKDFRPWLMQAKEAGAQGIYAGGLSWSGVDELAPRLQSEGIFDPGSPYLGIDGFPDLAHGISDYQEPTADPMLNGHMYASRGIGSPYLNRKAAGAIAAFVKLHKDPVENNSQAFAGYDAASILIDAIGRAIDADCGKIPSRRQVVDQLSKTKNFSGLTGTYTFNADGDPVMSTLQILKYRAGAWTALTNVRVASH